VSITVASAPAAARALIERVFQGAVAHAAQYPLVFEPGRAGRIVALVEHGVARSACAILRRDLVVAGEVLPAGLIGSVATDPAWRGRGLATRVLREAERRLRQDGAELAFLWADDAAFYHRLGWREVGVEHDWVVGPELATRLPEPTAVRAMGPDDTRALHGLYERHAVRTARTELETRALLATPGMNVLVRLRDGVPCAYACVGRGNDLHGVVHEWAGAEADVLALVRAHLDQARTEHGPLIVMASPAADLPGLTRLGAPHAVGVLGMGKIVDQDAVARRFARSVPDLAARVRRTEDATAFELAGPRTALELEPGDALELLLPPRDARGDLDRVGAALGLPLEPLSRTPFVWGLDSI
jgi:predicted N-acetyltransferase YhbS